MSKSTKPDILIVITDAAKDQAAIFPLTDVTGFDLRGNGALAILNGKEIVNAYAAGYWQRAFFYTQAKFDEANVKASEVAQMQAASTEVADKILTTAPMSFSSGADADNVAEFPTPAQ